MLVTARSLSRRRRGAVLVEGAFVITTFLTLILGTIDLGLAVFRQQIVSRAARQGARLASVHGAVAPAGFGGPWGTATIDVYASASGTPIVDGMAASGSFNGLNPTQTHIVAEWIDGTNDPEAEKNRVRVTVTTPYTPMITSLFGTSSYTLSAVSVMNVAH